MPHLFSEPHAPATLLRGALFWALIGLTLAVLAPALYGPFVADDQPNLVGLARVDDWFSVEFWVYLWTGIAGPTGRPLSLFSFALQFPAWPVAPQVFRHVNLMLHLLVGCGVALLALRIARQRFGHDAPRTEWIALVAVAIWLLHPIQVSSVVYIVQRMTQLSTLFIVFGLLAYCRGRQLAGQDPAGWRGPLWAAAGIGGGGLLAVLSKETGVLILAYAAVLELTVLPQPAPPRWLWTRRALLYAPAAAFALLVVMRWDSLISAKYAIREFTLADRLLTEPRVLLDYLRLILLPAPDEFGLFHDDYRPSSGLLQPWTTLPALLGVVGLLALGWRLRERAPALAFAILWFFAGHLLESTLLPIELYFEHRNYLPLFGPALAAGHYALRLPELLQRPAARWLSGLGLAALALLLAALSHGEAYVWGTPAKLAPVWAHEHPDSMRAQDYLAGLLKSMRAYPAAAREYARQVERFPLDSAPYIDWLELGCLDESVDLPEPAAMQARLRSARFSYAPFAGLERMVTRFETDGDCGRVYGSQVLAILDALVANPAMAPERALLLILRARLHAVRLELPAALTDLDAALAERPRLDIALRRVHIAVSADDRVAARRYLDEARTMSIGTPFARFAARERFEEWEAALSRLESLPRRPAPAERGADDRDP